eukprot:maker-scaffold84_size396325-snap-gene-1.18 protein:Tk09685 transcript:maker-scaffold84_size396325-snap-gene-1.18-mRNA-1 annotation:"vacuolar protein-sorting protein bro1"
MGGWRRGQSSGHIGGGFSRTLDDLANHFDAAGDAGEVHIGATTQTGGQFLQLIGTHGAHETAQLLGGFGNGGGGLSDLLRRGVQVTLDWGEHNGSLECKGLWGRSLSGGHLGGRTRRTLDDLAHHFDAAGNTGEVHVGAAAQTGGQFLQLLGAHGAHEAAQLLGGFSNGGGGLFDLLRSSFQVTLGRGEGKIELSVGGHVLVSEVVARAELLVLLSTAVLGQQNYQYRYQPKDGEFKYEFEQDPKLLALSRDDVAVSASVAADGTRRVVELLKKFDVNEIAELLGADQGTQPGIDFEALAGQIENSATLLEKSGPAIANIIEKVKERFPASAAAGPPPPAPSASTYGAAPQYGPVPYAQQPAQYAYNQQPAQYAYPSYASQPKGYRK